MPQQVTFAGRANALRSLDSRATVQHFRVSRLTLLAAIGILAAYFIAGSRANGQTPFPSDATQSTTQTPGDEGSTATAPATQDFGEENRAADRVTPTAIGGPNAASTTTVALPAGQIIHILQQSPDLVVELKSLVADRMQEQGAPINANDISDEMLYQRISASPSLRASITTFLRARGYVTDDDLQPLRQAAGSGSVDNQLPAESANLFAAGSSVEGGPPGIDTNGLPMGRTRRMQTSPGRREKQRNEKVNASTDEPKVLRLTAPYNLRSMRDLYTQIPEPAATLKRFGSEVFINRDSDAAMRGLSNHDTPLDVPLGPDYIVGPGDMLTIDLWGNLTQRISRLVDRDGTVLLPEAGSLPVAGLSLEKVQERIEGALKRQYRNLQVAVTVARLRSVRVYVVGDVQRPGGYDISALATPLSALYAAGGPTAVGSLRIVRHFRGDTLVEEVDLYDFLLHGFRNGSAHFESGDTLLVPPAGPQIAVFGAIKRPAIYELKPGESTLATVIEDAGGFTAAASFGHISIERIDANLRRETLTVNIADKQGPQAVHDAIAAFQVKDGDRIRIGPVLPYSQRAIYLAGHVARPGRLPYTDGMRLSDVLHSYRDMLPEPAVHGEIVRLVAPDLHAETIDFNVPDVLIGNANVDLQPFDTVRIFGRYETDAPKVTVLGEVLRPGTYPMSNGMTAAQLVRMAGGFKRDALLDNADFTSYRIVNGNRIVERIGTVQIGAAVAAPDAHADVPLKAGDILTVHQITGWNDIGESITINGQVRFPGNYGFRDGERLSSVLRRAGGLLPAAYPMGAVLVREQVRELEQKSREELIRQIQTNSAAARLSPNLAGGNAGGTLQVIQAQQDEVIADLKSHPPTGRMVIHIGADIDSWANTPADIELRRGDVLTIPKQPGFVLITGQVYNATALTFAPGKTAGWYLRHAGGANSTGNRKDIFIIRANGSVVGRRSGSWFAGNVLSTRLNPGDVVVVPQKIIGASLLWKNLLTTAQLASSIAITAAIAVATL